MMNDAPHGDSEIVPDYGTTLVWSNDDAKSMGLLLGKFNGDLGAALGALFRAGGTTYEEARRLSIRFSNSLGLTELEFMKKYRKWKLGETI